jgi:hypothetical protein
MSKMNTPFGLADRGKSGSLNGLGLIDSVSTRKLQAVNVLQLHLAWGNKRTVYLFSA